MKFSILDHLPPRLLEHPAPALARYLDGPTLIHLPGRRPEPLFVSVLQHGNEPSGWDAVRRLLAGRYRTDPLPRSLVLFIGNVAAAAEHKRFLPGQPDPNRCWPGSRSPETPWHRILAELTAHVRALRPFASIDIHNNTGENPHYAAVNRIDARALYLASRFSRTVVYFTEPAGVQSAAFAEFCPSVTLECGPPGKRGGADHALAYLENVLNAGPMPAIWPEPEDLDLFEVTTVVEIPEACSFAFGNGPEAADIRFEANLDRLNFTEMPPGTRLARVERPGATLRARGTDGGDCTGAWFRADDGQLVTLRPAMPAMLTTHAEAVRQDCLCYLMERVSIDHPGAAVDMPAELPEGSSRDAATRDATTMEPGRTSAES